jgi:hypothetical protein
MPIQRNSKERSRIGRVYTACPSIRETDRYLQNKNPVILSTCAIDLTLPKEPHPARRTKAAAASRKRRGRVFKSLHDARRYYRVTVLHAVLF